MGRCRCAKRQLLWWVLATPVGNSSSGSGVRHKITAAERAGRRAGKEEALAWTGKRVGAPATTVTSHHLPDVPVVDERGLSRHVTNTTIGRVVG